MGTQDTTHTVCEVSSRSEGRLRPQRRPNFSQGRQVERVPVTPDGSRRLRLVLRPRPLHNTPPRAAARRWRSRVETPWGAVSRDEVGPVSAGPVPAARGAKPRMRPGRARGNKHTVGNTPRGWQRGARGETRQTQAPGVLQGRGKGSGCLSTEDALPRRPPNLTLTGYRRLARRSAASSSATDGGR